MQKAAHEALTNMHQMSLAAIDALNRVSSLLRVSNLAPNGCPNEVVMQSDTLPMMAGQAIIALKTDYSIGDAEWYIVNASETSRPRTLSATPSHLTIRATLGWTSGQRV